MKCRCGTVKSVRQLNHILSGKSLSCGCLRRERRAERNKTHGMSKHPLYAMWKGMHNRCRNKNSGQYEDYGGRGVMVCERWSGQMGFSNFVADMGDRPGGYTIERKDNEKGYEPGNCFWAPRKVQARNKRNNRLLVAFGRTQCLTAWAEEYEMSKAKLYHRIVTMKLDPETALTLPGRYKTR